MISSGGSRDGNVTRTGLFSIPWWVMVKGKLLWGGFSSGPRVVLSCWRVETSLCQG